MKKNQDIESRAEITIPARRWPLRVQALAFGLLLACLGARFFLAEMQFRISPVPFSLMNTHAKDLAATPRVDRVELSRATFVCLLFLSGSLWFAAGAFIKRTATLTIQSCSFGIMLLVFAGLSLVSTLTSEDFTGGLLAWFELVSILFAGFLAMEMCRNRERFLVLVMVLAGIGIALAIKGFYQSFIEIPTQQALFESDSDKMLQRAGIAAGSIEARNIADRLAKSAPTGYSGLANVFASGLLILGGAGAGLTIEKFRQARLRRTKDKTASMRKKTSRKNTQIHLPTLAAALSLLALIATIGCVFLSGSAGAIASLIIGMVALLAIWRWRFFLAKRRRSVLWVAAGVFGILMLATAYRGMVYDNLAVKTMTVRWHYWNGSAEIIKENPIIGVGPGGFDSAYMRHRRDDAEEAVKSPHNLIAASLSQFGLVGGGILIAMVIYVLLAITKPASKQAISISRCPYSAESNQSKKMFLWAGFVTLGIFAARLLLAPTGSALVDWVWASMLCIVVIAPSFALSFWWGFNDNSRANRASQNDVSLAAIRIALGVAAAAFVLHNMVTISMDIPATALAFWVAISACSGVKPSAITKPSWLKYATISSMSIAAFVLAAIFIFIPAYKKQQLTQQMIESYVQQNYDRATAFAIASSNVDTSDAMSAATCAKTLQLIASRKASTDLLQDVKKWYLIATRRDPSSAHYAKMAGKTAWEAKYPDSFKYAWRRSAALPKKSVNQLKNQLSKGIVDTKVTTVLAESLFLANSVDESLKFCRQAVKIDPTSQELAEHLGNLEYFAGNASFAIKSWQKARLLRTIASRSTKREYTTAAVKHYQRAIRLDPVSTRPRLEYAHLLCKIGRFKEAISQLAKVEHYNSNLPAESVMVLGNAEMRFFEMLCFRCRSRKTDALR